MVDTAIFLILFALYAVIKDRKHLKRNLFIFASILIFLPAVAMKTPRISGILRKGVYADASMASRWFRANACLKGMSDDPYDCLFGAGMGNLYLSFNRGYEEAKAEYANDYTKEVDELMDSDDVTSVFNLPIKILAEFGLIILLLGIIWILFYRKKVDVFTILMSLWLYIQFDSYAFYTLWIIVFIINYQRVLKLSDPYFYRINRLLVRK